VGLVPSDIFASDLYKPSVDYKENIGTGHSLTDSASGSKASMTPEPEAMDIEEEGLCPMTYRTSASRTYNTLSMGPSPRI